jgi:surfeit locus 1 family protein
VRRPRGTATYRRGVLKTALQPRWLALLALVLVVCAGFGWLGSWQLGVARDKGAVASAREVANQPPAPIEQVLAPQQGFLTSADTRAVTVRGSYDPGRQVLVANRLQQGRSGWWVVQAVRTSAGAWLPAVRGWVADPSDPAAAPSSAPRGDVVVSGVLLPDDAPDDASPPQTVVGRLNALDAAELVNLWGGPIYNGFVVVSDERTASGAVATVGAQPERVPRPQPQPGGLAWRNAAYAVQWWVFAGFALVLWWKMVRQDVRERADAETIDEKVAV